MSTKIIQVSLVIVFSFLPRSAIAAAYYVDYLRGNNTNTGTVATAPWQADAVALEKSVLPLPITVDATLFAGPVTILTGIMPEPQGAFGDGDSRRPSAESLLGPSKTARFGIGSGMIEAVNMFDVRRTFAGESPLAAFLGLLVGALIMVGMYHRQRHDTPAPRREPHGLRAGYRASAAVAQSDFRIVNFVSAPAMVPVGGYAQTGFGQSSFAEVSFGRPRFGRDSFGTGDFGQSGFRDIDCGDDSAVNGTYGNRDPVIVVYSEAAGGERNSAELTAAQPEWSEASALVKRSTRNVLAEDYRIFTLDGGDVRSCQQFSAADDHEALAQARLCEPTKAFELWRGSQFVTRRPSIQ